MVSFTEWIIRHYSRVDEEWTGQTGSSPRSLKTVGERETVKWKGTITCPLVKETGNLTENNLFLYQLGCFLLQQSERPGVSWGLHWARATWLSLIFNSLTATHPRPGFSYAPSSSGLAPVLAEWGVAPGLACLLGRPVLDRSESSKTRKPQQMMFVLIASGRMNELWRLSWLVWTPEVWVGAR